MEPAGGGGGHVVVALLPLQVLASLEDPPIPVTLHHTVYTLYTLVFIYSIFAAACCRAFLSTTSFAHMASKEIIRLCGMELGAQGKEMAKGERGGTRREGGVIAALVLLVLLLLLLLLLLQCVCGGCNKKTPVLLTRS